MKSPQQIKQQIVTALETCGVFDTVTTPSDDRQDRTLMREPSAAVFYSGMDISEDRGVLIKTSVFLIYMRFLKIGVNETAEDIELAVDAVAGLEPVSLTQKRLDTDNLRSGHYLIEAHFAGCRE